MPVPSIVARARRPVGRSFLLLAALMACAKGDSRTDTSVAGGAIRAAPGDSATASTTSPGAASTSHSDSMAGMQGMSGMQGMKMTGDPDHDFLRMMSDHHKGMIGMAHLATEEKKASASAADAKKLDAKQDSELDKMITMLDKDFKDQYTPMLMPDNQAMIDELKEKNGKEFDRTFYQNVVKHHQQAIKMIDDYLQKGKNAAIKQMAQKMKADQQKEISEFERKAGQS